MQWRSVPTAILGATVRPETLCILDEARWIVAGSRKRGALGLLKRLSGSDERAVILESTDGGNTWSELPMRISFGQLWLPRAWLNWPPDDISRITSEQGDLVAYFEDGWITWERGCTWKAMYQAPSRSWHVTKLERI